MVKEYTEYHHLITAYRCGLARFVRLAACISFALLLAWSAVAAVRPFGIPWSMVGRDAEHGGQAASVGPTDPSLLSAPWPYVVPGSIQSQPVISYGGTAFIGGGDGALHAVGLNARGGPVHVVGAPITGSPAVFVDALPPGEGEAVAPASVYFGADDHAVYAVLADGTLKWRTIPGLLMQNKSPVRSSPVVATLAPGLRRVYVGAESGMVYAIFESTPNSASTQWEASISASALRTSPALSTDTNLVYVGTSDGRLHCLDAFTGQQLPGTPVAVSPGQSLSTPSVDGAGQVYVTDASGSLHGLSPDCTLQWSVPIGRSPGPPAIGVHGEVFVVADGTLHAVSTSGAAQWTEPLNHTTDALAPAVDGIGNAYVATRDGWVVSVAPSPTAGSSRTRWQVEVHSGAALTSPVIDEHGRIYVAQSTGQLHVIDELPAFQLAYDSNALRPPNQEVFSLREIYGVVDPARTLQLTNDPGMDSQPAYSLDRRTMAFVSDRDGSADVFLASVLGTDAANVSGLGTSLPPNSLESGPAFTPIDDRLGYGLPMNALPQVAFTTNATGQSRVIFLDLKSHAAGTPIISTLSAWAGSLGKLSPQVLTKLEPPNTDQSAITFSPDGLKVAWRHCEPAQRRGEIRLLLLRGGIWELHTAGKSFQFDPEVPEPCKDDLTFAPDSRWLAFREGMRLSIADVNFFEPSWTNPRVVVSTQQAGEPRNPSWSPDGSTIAIGLFRAGAVDVVALSASAYSTGQKLAATSDEPFYHYFRMPPPQAVSLLPEIQFPRSTVNISGRGFDIIHPDNNKVYFQDTLRRTLHQAQIVTAQVDPVAGLGVLTVEVPDFAGHGPVLVETPFGSTSSPSFTVAPLISRVVQQRSVVGAKIRLFGLGIDLSPSQDNIVEFNPGATATGTSTGVRAVVVDGGIDVAGEEFLTVRVPFGIPSTGSMPIGVFANHPTRLGSKVNGFSLLHPTLTLARTTGLPSYAKQGCTGVTVTLTGTDFPRDPFFDVGTSSVAVDEVALGGVPPIISVPFQAAGVDTAIIPPTTFAFPSLGANHTGGDLVLRATDAMEPAATAETLFRVPLTDIPIVFVPGTSGSSLDLSPAITPPWRLGFSGDEHHFPTICKTCRPFLSPPNILFPPTWFGWLGHPSIPFSYNPGSTDPRGPRVWLGPEGINHVLAGTLAGNAGNHYLNAIEFDATGNPANPQIVPGTVFSDVTGSFLVPTTSVYKPFIDFITNSSTVQSPALDRPLCAGPSGPCFDSSGATTGGKNGLYLFNLDWRDSNPREAARLATFIDSVLAFSGAPKVAIITHSYGGPVARSYYLDPANKAEAKVDQVISLGGGFLGVIEPFRILEMGSTWGLGKGFGILSGGFAEWETKHLAQNWPTAYFQMPSSESWFYDHVPGGTPDRSYVRENFLFGKGHIATYRESMDWLVGRAPEDNMSRNAGLARSQMTYFNPPSGPPLELGDFRNGTGAIYHHRIISRGRMDTVVAVEILSLPSLAALAPFLYDIVPLSPQWYAELFPVVTKFAVYGDGDSTIPYHGALGMVDATKEDRVYILNGAIHNDLLNLGQMLFVAGTPSIKGLIPSLLDGTVCSQPQISNLFRSQNDVSENLSRSWIPLSLAVPLREEPAPFETTSWRIELRSSGAGLTIETDDDQRVHWGGGLHDERLEENSISGATVDQGPSQKTVLLTKPGVYRISVFGKVPFVSPKLYISSFSDSGRGETLLYRGLQLFEGRRADVTFVTGDADPHELRVSTPGFPGFERISPTVLTASDMFDKEPPTTELALQGKMVVASARDNDEGTGVFRTWYAVEGEAPHLYEGPFSVPVEAVAVSAFSEDLAGNLEYPGARLQLRQ